MSSSTPLTKNMQSIFNIETGVKTPASFLDKLDVKRLINFYKKILTFLKIFAIIFIENLKGENSMEQFYIDFAIFFGLQLINVVLGTLRSILTVSANAHVGAVINAVSFTFYNAVVKMITKQDMEIVLVTTFFTNLLGVYLAKAILDMVRKDKLWVFCATIKKRSDNDGIDTVIAMLDNAKIKYVYNTVVPNKLFTMQIFSYNQKESAMITQILKNYNVKYYITETK